VEPPLTVTLVRLVWPCLVVLKSGEGISFSESGRDIMYCIGDDLEKCVSVVVLVGFKIWQSKCLVSYALYLVHVTFLLPLEIGRSSVAWWKGTLYWFFSWIHDTALCWQSDV
jgi:hypothetical protein